MRRDSRSVNEWKARNAMKNVTAPAVFAVIVLALAGMPPGASAAEIKALATIALQSVLEDLAPRFEKASGHKVSVEFGLGVAMVKRVQEGASADFLLAPRSGIDALLKAGKVVPGS